MKSSRLMAAGWKPPPSLFCRAKYVAIMPWSWMNPRTAAYEALRLDISALKEYYDS
jgi:hypothetical protein